MEHNVLLILMGFLIGAYGTLIGAGGGFVLMPVLLLLYPRESPEILTSISLTVVFFNALSGSWAYSRMKRIDYQSGLLFSAATIPGAILGALSTASLARRPFDIFFGLLMIAAPIFLLSHPGRKKPIGVSPQYEVTRSIVEADGTRHMFSYNPTSGWG